MGTIDTTKPNLDSIMNERKAFDETKAGVKGLVDGGLKKIPELFHHQPDKYEKANNMSNVIPVIDLADSDDKDSSIHQGIVKKVKKACETLGFFQVVNHGISLRVLDEMKDGVKRFYEQDTEVKKDFYTRDISRSISVDRLFTIAMLIFIALQHSIGRIVLVVTWLHLILSNQKSFLWYARMFICSLKFGYYHL
jgi:hypothetical protein